MRMLASARVYRGLATCFLTMEQLRASLLRACDECRAPSAVREGLVSAVLSKYLELEKGVAELDRLSAGSTAETLSVRAEPRTLGARSTRCNVCCPSSGTLPRHLFGAGGPWRGCRRCVAACAAGSTQRIPVHQ
jgi:hypothetical protein